MAKRDITIETGTSREAHKLKPFKLDGCIRFKAKRGPWFEKKKVLGGIAREFTICATGGDREGKGHAIQIMTPGNKELLVGTTQKACRLSSPGVHYASDLDADAYSSIRELHGTRSRKRRRK